MEFIKDLWRGDVGFPFTFWVVAVVGNVLFKGIDNSLVAAGFYDTVTVGMLIFTWTFFAVLNSYFIFSLVCVWRSANKYEGSAIFAVLAKVGMVIVALFLILTIAIAFTTV